MDIQKIAKDFKNNIKDYSTEDIEKTFVQFAELVLKQHLSTERELAKLEIQDNIKRGGNPRPILVAYLGIGDMDSDRVNDYISRTNSVLNSIIPQMEYLTLVAPVRTSETKFELLSASTLSEEDKLKTLEKVAALELIFNNNFKSK